MAAHKLNLEARLLVAQRIVAGDTNSQIRAALKAAGHPSDITDQSFSEYRAWKSVKAALERKEAEALQAGLAQRAVRISRMCRHAAALERRLYLSPDDVDIAQGPPMDVSQISREYRGAVMDISKLCGDDKTTVALEAGENALSLLRSFLGVKDTPDKKVVDGE